MYSSSSSDLDDEEIAKTEAAVDLTFLQNYREQNDNGRQHQTISRLKSERYLNVAAHYNDVVVPKELQSKFSAALSALIEKKIEFIEPESAKITRSKTKGGVRLFSDSSQYLSTDEPVDTTAEHNKRSQLLNKKSKRLVDNESSLTDTDKLRMSAVTADHILSGDETKHWQSRRKEKLFRYKQRSKSKVLVSLQE